MANHWLPAALAASATLLVACSGDTPDDLCRYEDAEQSGLQVEAPAEAWFYAHDQGGIQVGYEKGGSVLALEPAAYDARLSGSHHAVTVRAGQVTRCAVASLTVTGTTDEYYYVLDTLNTQLGYAKLGQLTPLFPGVYAVKVNDVIARTAVSAADPVTLAAATFNVTGTTDEYYYVLDPAGTQLAYAKLGQPLSLLAGSYIARVNNSQAPFTTEAGGAAQLAAGTVLGKGTTEDYYYVLNSSGDQLGYARLGNPLSLLPGTYQFRLTGAIVPVTVEPGQASTVASGTLLVTGPGTEYYYVLDANGTQLGYNRLNTPTPLLAGTYGVRMADRTTSVMIAADSTTTVTR